MLISILPAQAQVDLQTAVKLPGGDNLDSTVYNPGGLISIVLRNGIIFAGIILLFLFLGGGFMIVSGGGNPEQVQKGQKTVVGALIGFIIIASAFWIVQILQVITGQPNILTGGQVTP